VKRGRGLIKLNGAPIELVRPEGMKASDRHCHCDAPLNERISGTAVDW
jgi:hypothetical protein